MMILKQSNARYGLSIRKYISSIFASVYQIPMMKMYGILRDMLFTLEIGNTN